jgi:hypothetical protein
MRHMAMCTRVGVGVFVGRGSTRRICNRKSHDKVGAEGDADEIFCLS